MSGILEMQERAIWLGLVAVLALLILRFLLRKKSLAAVTLIAIAVVLVWSSIPHAWGVRAIVATGVTFIFTLQVFTLIRFGLMAFVVGWFCFGLLDWPITTDTSTWYFQTGIGAILVVFAIAGYGFYTSLGKTAIRAT